MPVTGLPAAMEAALTTLIQTQGLLSWTIVGEGRTTVAVLRFKPENGLPFANTNSEYWRRKPPSQRRRDQQRRNAYQQRFEHPLPHSQPRTNDHVDIRSTSAIAMNSKLEDENGSNVLEELHEPRPAPASEDARSSRPPSASSVCTAAVSRGENCANTDVFTDTAEATDQTQVGSKDESSEEVTPEALRESLDKFRRDLEDERRRSLDSMCSAIRGCVDSFSFPPVMPPPTLSATEEQGSGTSPLGDVIDGNRAAPDQLPSQTDPMCAAVKRRVESCRRDNRRQVNNSPTGRVLRSNRK